MRHNFVPVSMRSIKGHLRKLLPDSVLAWRRRQLESKMKNELLRCTDAKDIFTKIYDRGYWGRSGNRGERYYSGSGSHRSDIVDTYVFAVTDFLSSLGKRADAVDLGCGDFAIGSRIRPSCGKYIACDVVDGLIIHNRARYSKSEVEFRVVDIVNDELPAGDVVIIRQVLQHLSNSDIEKVVAKLKGYRFIILTEHLPVSDTFVPNLDKPTGPDIRISIGESGSGVLLTEPPFNLGIRHSRLLCQAFEDISGVRGVIRTNLYSL